MPPSSRKRSARAGSDTQGPAKRTRVNKITAQSDDEEATTGAARDEKDIKGEDEAKLNPTTRNPRKAKATTTSASGPAGGGSTDTATTKVTKTKETKIKSLESDSKRTKNPKNTKQPTKTEALKLEDREKTEDEDDTDIKAETPTKTARKRKATKEDKTGGPENPIKGEEASPQKPKRKRKTQEEKDAEAMPLAARSTGLRMYIGAHVSGAKGVQNAVTNCVHIGGNAFALFLKSQRKWDNPPLQDEHRDAFRANCVEYKYDATRHIVPHGSYLVNLAQEDSDKAKQAYTSFIEDLHRCEALGIKLYNFHPGTTNNSPRPAAIARIASALK
ncbi:MAG: hypothetical protein Q9216_002102 [Gyalolechia sp. 2 TL-2023]